MEGRFGGVGPTHSGAVPQEGTVPLPVELPAQRCLHELIAVQAERRPQGIALLAPGRLPLTYSRLQQQVSATAARLSTFGIGRNDRVALVLPNGPEMIVAFLAVSTVGTGAPLNPSCHKHEFDSYLSRLRPKAIVAQAGQDSPVRAVAREHKVAVIELHPDPAAEAGVFTVVGGEGYPAAARQLARPEDVALVLWTSGTTGKPKLIVHTHARLCTQITRRGVPLRLTHDDRALNVMPLYHSHGLNGVVLPSLVVGGSVVCAPGFLAPRFFEWLEEFRPTWYSAVPAIHQAVLRQAIQRCDAAERIAFRFIRSNSASLSHRDMERLEATFRAPVIDDYGLMEAPLIACSALPPGKRKPGSAGRSVGPELGIVDEAGNLLPAGSIGEVVARDLPVLHQYENAPEEDYLIDGWFHTGDQGFLDAEGYLFITGRVKEIINRGGEKIAPYEVEAVLLSHPDVADAVVFGMPEQRLGEDVAAAVVLSQKASAQELDLREFVAHRLAEFKVPSRIMIVDEIPRTPIGKVKRIGLAERLGVTSSRVWLPSKYQAEFVAPRTPLEAKLAAVWMQVLGLPRVGVHDDFLSLGGDSILATQIIARVHEATQVAITMPRFLETPTIAGLALAVTVAEAAQTDPEKLAQILNELKGPTDGEARGCPKGQA